MFCKTLKNLPQFINIIYFLLERNVCVTFLNAGLLIIYINDDACQIVIFKVLDILETKLSITMQS